MVTAKLPSKCQITIPKEVRNKLGIVSGEAIIFEEKNGVFYIRKGFRKSTFNKWIGCFKNAQVKKTDTIIEELRGK
jgi:AbrB family looped-hinge helix DNA binding protein